MDAAFAKAFRASVLPTLKVQARWHGSQVALDLWSFAHAYDTLLAAARKHGAVLLPDDLLADLEQFIADEILRALVEFEPSVLEQREIADRVAKDIAKWEESMRA